jgi:hypothetical protein
MLQPNCTPVYGGSYHNPVPHSAVPEMHHLDLEAMPMPGAIVTPASLEVQFLLEENSSLLYCDAQKMFHFRD